MVSIKQFLLASLAKKKLISCKVAMLIYVFLYFQFVVHLLKRYLNFFNDFKDYYDDCFLLFKNFFIFK